MLLAGDAESQTEHRLLTKELDLQNEVIKIAHQDRSMLLQMIF